MSSNNTNAISFPSASDLLKLSGYTPESEKEYELRKFDEAFEQMAINQKVNSQLCIENKSN